MKSTSFILLFLSLTLFSCNKNKPCDDNGLPCFTSEGKNTFGCLIDGVPFVAKTSFSIGGAVALSGQFDEESKLLQVQGSREDANEHVESIKFKVYVTQQIGAYTMSVNTDNYQGYTYSNNPNVCIYYHDINNKGSVTVLYLDTESNVISGTFSMTLINEDCPKESMAITNGRFDFAY